MECDSLTNTKTEQNGIVYKFEVEEKEKCQVSRFRLRVWQYFPSVCALLISVPYGMSLGWPSPIYPKIINEGNPISISYDQSAMIAGFLMIGNSLGTPFSNAVFMGPKYNMIIGCSVMTIGWTLMWEADNIYWILSSRILTGLGYGFSNGQLKIYIKNMCESDLAATLTSTINLFTFLGVLVVFCYSPFFGFYDTALISMFITIAVLILISFLPHTPKEMVQSNKLKNAKMMLRYIKPEKNLEDVLNEISKSIDDITVNLTFFAILKDKNLRKSLSIILVLVFFQQFTGIPATIIYSQILFTRSSVPYPLYFAILYAFIFLLSNIFGVFVSSKFRPKRTLLLTSFLLSIVISLKIVVIYLNINQVFWSYTSVIVMLCYAILHTIGLGTIPFTYIAVLFPKNARLKVTHFFIICHSMFALIITKIFQVLITNFTLYIPFGLFLCVCVLSLVVVPFISTDLKGNGGKIKPPDDV